MDNPYKKKYLKYKNKYYNLIKNKTKQHGGSELLTITLITLIISIIGFGSYLYINNKNEIVGQQQIHVIQKNIDKQIEDFFKLLYSVLNDKYNHNLYNTLLNYYKYDNVDLSKIKNKTFEKTPELYINELINLNSKLKTSMPILKLIPLDDTQKQKDSLMFCLKKSLMNSYIDSKFTNLIINKSTTDMRKNLLEYINNNSHFDIYFQEQNTNLNNTNQIDNNQSNIDKSKNINKDYTQKNKSRFIEFMNKLGNENIVSDLPMVHAAAELYEVYIVLIINLTNARYIKFYKPKITDSTKQPSKKNTILLSYFNYCNYQCDFMNNDNIHLLTNNLISNNIPLSLTSNIINMNNYDNSKINNLTTIDYNGENENKTESTLRKFNFNYADTKIDNALDEHEILNYHNKYNNSIDHLNKILHDNNLIHNEKTNINQKINVKPWYQYYELNINFWKINNEDKTYVNSTMQNNPNLIDSF
tara:strand:- start:674 stop:2092 length:1419 start_codon:yes stop_codon:yes gene_type:complete